MSVFKFSQKGKQLSIDELQENLFKLLPAADDQTTLLDQVLLDPTYLVGQRINHRFDVNEELIWYKGTVKKYCSQTKKFIVNYDCEDDPCSFHLIEDIASGDLVLL